MRRAIFANSTQKSKQLDMYIHHSLKPSHAKMRESCDTAEEQVGVIEILWYLHLEAFHVCSSWTGWGRKRV